MRCVPLLRRAAEASVRLFLLLLVAGASGVAGEARADCALIPAALKEIPSTFGSVDRPFAAPGDTVTVLSNPSKSSCRPGPDEVHFDPTAANNEITLVFEPPTGVAPPAVPPFPASAVVQSTCGAGGAGRCFALEFQMPDTTPETAGPYPLTGPARIEVRNLAAGGALAAEVGPLYQSASGCNLDNRAPNLFQHFTVLPPRNVYAGASATLNATVDGSGSLLIPMDYSPVLASPVGNDAAVRLLTVNILDGSFPNGLAAGNGLPGIDGSEIRIPRESGRFLRAFSLGGRPIPPLLKVTATTPLARASDGLAFGDTILGSVDFVDSVIRIARTESDPLTGSPLSILSIPKEPGAPTGLTLRDGVGPIEITGVTLATGAAAPLNSLNASQDLAVVARSDVLANPSAPNSDLIVEFTGLADGSQVDTGTAVVQTARSPRKPVIATKGTSVAFFQSERFQGLGDLNGDGHVADSIFRVWTADGSHPACPPGTPCDLTAFLPAVTADPALLIEGPDSPSPVVISGIADPGRFVFFGASEVEALPFTNERASVQFTGAQATQPSYDPALSSDGRVVGFTSQEADTAEFAGAVAPGRPGSVTYTYTGNDFDTIIDSPAFPGTYDTSQRVTVTILRDSLLPPNLSNVSLTAVLGGRNIILHDGRMIVASANNNFAPNLEVSTDGSGNITEWNINLADCFGNCSILTRSATVGGTSPGALDRGFLNDENPPSTPLNDRDIATVSNNPGVWVTDTTPERQVWIRTRATSANRLVSSNGERNIPGDGPSDNVSLGATGDFIAFDSEATTLISEQGPNVCCPVGFSFFLPDVEGHRDVFLRDMTSGPTAFGETVLRVSGQNGSSGLNGGNGASSKPDLSNGDDWIAYESLATNLTGGADTNGVSDVFVNRRTLNFDANERVSLTDVGGEANGASTEAAISADGSEVAFQSDATNLVGSDTNGVTDIYLRDRSAATTERISVGYAGAQANGVSTRPDLSDDGRYVVFRSSATNLLPPGIVLNQPGQCYVRDRLRGRTELVSATLGGEGSDAACLEPAISASGRFVSFAAAATNLVAGTDAVRRIYLFDRLTGINGVINQGLGGISVGPTGTRSGLAEGPTGGIVYDSPAGDLLGGLDTNGLSDVYGAVLLDAASPGLNTGGPFPDSDDDDSVLQVFDTSAATPGLTNTQLPVTQVAVAGGRAAVVPHPVGGLGQIWDAEGGGVLRAMTVAPVEVALSETIFCAVDGAGTLHVGDPTTGISQSAGVTVQAGIAASGNRCLYRDATGQLGFVAGIGGPLTSIAPARDFQAGGGGVAFRTCEADLTVPADLNGDTDVSDCVMRFYDFGTATLTDTGHTAALCTFPGCDPFFEPYRVRPGIVSFVTFESQEVDSGGTDNRGGSCLSTSKPFECDKTGDRDGDDVAIEIYSLASGKAQVFPLAKNLPPEVAPFPEVATGDTGNLMKIQLPASVLGADFAAEPPDRLVTVILGDPEGDGVFEADGNLDPQTAVVDLCEEVFDPSQIDLDRDGMAQACDRQLSTGLPNDSPTNPPAPAQIPGSDPTKLCNLNSLQNPADVTITRAEVDQIWADRGTPISAPADLDGVGALDATDLRDRDADGAVTAVDFQLCLADCAAQTGGCPATELDPTPAGYKACGLLGLEALLVLIPWMRWRKRMLR